MKRNVFAVIVGVVLLLIFGLLLFVFQVRVTEVAIVTTFGRPTRPLTEANMYFRWPWPIQKVTKLDRRIQNFESKFEETLTADGRNLLVAVYAGWRIADAALFYNRFANGSVTEAERSLEGLIRSAKSGVVGQHPFGDFISADPRALKFVDVEREILTQIQPAARQNYGIEVAFLGIKKMGLPESITGKVFERMKAERNKEAEKLIAQGEEQATKIRSAANLERDTLLSQADADATRIRSEGDAAAAQSYRIFEQSPDLAIFIQKLTALEWSLKDRATLILDADTPPFDLLRPSRPINSLPPPPRSGSASPAGNGKAGTP